MTPDNKAAVDELTRRINDVLIVLSGMELDQSIHRDAIVSARYMVVAAHAVAIAGVTE